MIYVRDSVVELVHTIVQTLLILVDELTFGILPGSDYFDGRFSNGPLWIEDLATRLGVPVPDHSLDGGTNYATGGAETGNGFTSFIVPNMAGR